MFDKVLLIVTFSWLSGHSFSGVLHIESEIKIEGESRCENKPCSGIILSINPTEIKILTARHCLEPDQMMSLLNDESMKRSDTTVKIRIHLPEGGTTIAGENPFRNFRNGSEWLDLAVLSAPINGNQYRVLRSTTRKWSTKRKHELRDKEKMVRVTNYLAESKEDSVSGSKYVSSDNPMEIEFSSETRVADGESGGALMTENNEIAGMIIKGGARPLAIPIQVIIDKLKSEQFQIDRFSFVKETPWVRLFALATLSLTAAGASSYQYTQHLHRANEFESNYDLTESQYRELQKRSDESYYASLALLTVSVASLVTAVVHYFQSGPHEKLIPSSRTAEE